MSAAGTCPLNRSQVVDLYFLEHRARVLDIAAFLDRLERAQPDGAPAVDDFRVAALRKSLEILLDGRPQRARRVLELWSDTSAEPLASAAGMKGAFGAPKP